MAQLEKFIKVTQEQYNTLQEGGTVGSHTGINPNFIYLVENNGDSEGGTVVEANPSEDATDVLTKLKVAGVTYSLPSGTPGDTPIDDTIHINVNLEDISLEPALDQGYALTLPLDSTTLAELQTNPRRSIHVHGLVDGEEVIQGAYLYSSDMTIDGSNGSFYGAVDIGFLSLIILETGSDMGVGLELMLSPNLREYLIFNDSDPDEPHLGILAFIGDDSSSVEANPTDTPTETLSTIKINDTVYSLPSGGEGGEGGSGQEIIIADMSWMTSQTTGVIPSQYRDAERLKKAIIVVPDEQVGTFAFRYSFSTGNYYYFTFLTSVDNRPNAIDYHIVLIDISNWEFSVGSGKFNNTKANFVLDGTETELKSIMVGDDYYKVPSAPQVVEITNVPNTATSGTLTQDQIEILQANNQNYIILNDELFRLNDKHTDTDYLVYAHNGCDATGSFYHKCITITLSTLG